MLARILAVLLASAAVWPAAAQLFGGDDPDEKKPWVELEAKPPAYPKDGNLLQFDAGAATPHRFFLDTESLSVGPDGVVRYTLVVKTAGGATNVSYEGIRCDTRQYKVYALGRRDGTWMETRDPQWRRIEYREVNRHHGVLYADILCRDRIPVKNAKDALEAIRSGTQ